MLIRQGLRFGVVGVAATATHFLIMSCAVECLGIDPVVATVPAFVVAFVVSYACNRRWTFGATAPHTRFVSRYLALALAGMGLNALIMHLSVHRMQWSYVIGFALGVLIVPAFSFAGARYFVFRPASDGPNRPARD